MPRFEIYNDTKGKFRYRLIADNNQEICTSSAYASKSNAKLGCEALSRNALEGVSDIKIRTDDVLKLEAKAERDLEKAKALELKKKEAEKVAAVKQKEKNRLAAEEKKTEKAAAAKKPTPKSTDTKKEENTKK